MFSKKLVTMLFVLGSLTVWQRAEAQGSAKACCDFVDDCSQLTDFEILVDARFDGSKLSHFGTCYFHDRSGCPDCACPFYVKVTHYDGAKGFDGGTGCLQTEKEVVDTLRQLCADGVCCCPQKKPTGVCPMPHRVWARDPLTGSCCEYANPCAAPDGWPRFPTEAACEG